MIIHHQDGTKMIITNVTGARMSNNGKCFLAFQSPMSGRKGIVELHPDEMKHILSAASKQNTEAEEQILRKLK